MTVERQQLYTLETIRLADLPEGRDFDSSMLKDAIALRARWEPPPIVVYRYVQQQTQRLDVYDGLRRIAAARHVGAETIVAAVCPTRARAERLRRQIKDGGGAARFWAARVVADVEPLTP